MGTGNWYYLTVFHQESEGKGDNSGEKFESASNEGRN